jgi:hypothetical protein
MTKHDFIFSNQRRHRLTRHIVFWVLWCLLFNLLFHFPMHVFKGWNISSPGNKNLQELGLPLFFIKTFFVNSLFGVIIPQILFTYTLIYWLLPNYFLKKRNPFVVGYATAGVLLIFILLLLYLNIPRFYITKLQEQVSTTRVLLLCNELFLLISSPAYL